MARPRPLAVLLRGGQLLALRPLDALPARVGSDPGCELQLVGEGVAAIHGELREGRRGLEWAPTGGARALPATAGSHFRVGDATLALAPSPGGSASDQLIASLAAMVPALFAAEPGEDAHKVVLSSLRGALDADWAALLAVDDDGAEVEAAEGKRPGRDDEAVSRNVLQKLRESDAPVLAVDLETDADLGQVASIHAEVRSVIAARVGAVGADARRAVYLERASSRAEFSPAERELLRAACALSGELLARASRARDLGSENQRLGALSRLALRDDDPLARMVGSGPRMRAVLDEVQRAAEAGVTALVLGESGTGKEMVARALHRASPRADRPFVAVHCMALARELVESELFGHAKGAFSGATADRVGRFEMAHGGTLFLDELGELSPEVQVKLLRVLEERAVQRVGEARERPVDVQLVAATNVDLEAAMAAGRFREDLYYRLSVFRIQLPPLRERLEDLPELIEHFVPAFARRHRRPITGVSAEAMAALRAHSWPGNLRELKNVLHQAVIRERGEVLGVESLGLRVQPPRAADLASPGEAGAPAALVARDEPENLDEARAAWEKAFLLRALRAEGGNVAATCRRLGVSSSALYRRFERYGIDPAEVR